MVLRNILLHLDNSPACETRIDVALALAREHAALLTGLSIATHGYYQPHHRQDEQELVEVGTRFRRKAADAGVMATWRELDSPVVGVGVVELLIRHAHSTDLVVVGQDGRQGRGKDRPSAMVQRLVLGGGRPVLIVPAAGTFPAVGKRVLVAWRTGREATRALNDALPILMRAQQVTLLAVSDVDAAADAENDPWGGIREHLLRHGVKPLLELLPATPSPLADTLLNRTCDGSFDLLVMGCFGTTSQGGTQLGPVAGQILREMTLPVLMAH